MIAGLGRLNLEPGQADYLLECVSAGRTWFVTRKRSKGRCIQASGESLEGVKRTFDGWRREGASIIQIDNNEVVWHTQKEAT